MDEPQRHGDPLYETDFFRWTQDQAERLRRAGAERVNAPLDWENLADEIEGLGRSERRELRNRIRGIIEHLAKLASPARDPRAGWIEEIETQRFDLEQVLDDSPSLRREVPAMVEAVTDRAFKAAAAALRHYGEPDAELTPWRRRGFTPEEVLTSGWFPPQPTTDALKDAP